MINEYKAFKRVVNSQTYKSYFKWYYAIRIFTFLFVTALSVTNLNAQAIGFLEICKTVSEGSGLENRVFQFRISSSINPEFLYLIPANGCSGPIALPSGQAVITEIGSYHIITGAPAGAGGFRLVNVFSDPEEAILDVNLPERTATVFIREGGIAQLTSVEFVNAVAPPDETVDTDGDGIENNADMDDDNDGQSDADETDCGSDPLDAANKSSDADNDNIPDCVDTDDDNDGIPDSCDVDSNPGAEDFDRDGMIDGSGCDSEIGPPVDKNQCKNGGWMRFNNPSFNNQGQCIIFVNGN